MDGAIIVSGVPGAGKSTVAALLAARFERAVHVEADRLQRMIVSGARWPGEEPLDEGFRQLRLRGRNACLLADSFREAGFTPVIDDIVVGRRLDEYLGDLRTRPVFFVLLLPDLETLRERNSTRTKADVFSQALDLDPVARHETRQVGLRLDTTGQTAEQTVAEIAARLATDAGIA